MEMNINLTHTTKDKAIDPACEGFGLLVDTWATGPSTTTRLIVTTITSAVPKVEFHVLSAAAAP